MQPHVDVHGAVVNHVQGMYARIHSCMQLLVSTGRACIGCWRNGTLLPTRRIHGCAGSWDNWNSQSTLTPSTEDGQPLRSTRGDAVRTLLVPRGVHDYKFIVDDKWRPAPSDPVARDQAVGAGR